MTKIGNMLAVVLLTSWVGSAQAGILTPANDSTVDGVITPADVVGTGTFVFDGPATAGSFLLIDLSDAAYRTVFLGGASLSGPPGPPDLSSVGMKGSYPGTVPMELPVSASPPKGVTVGPGLPAAARAPVAGIQPQAAIPEPTSIALLGLGLVGLGFSMRRKT